MNKEQTIFSGSIPENYDKYLGPLLFEFSAKDLAERVSKKIPAESKVLEIAGRQALELRFMLKLAKFKN